MKYNPNTIEKHWRQIWEDTDFHKAVDAPDPSKKYYCLDMFPYPSGTGLHVGHWRGYVLSDVLCRYQKLHGKQILHPMGWDAFGLPAELDALRKQTHPKINTQKNIDNIRRQLQEVGTMYDWSREISTVDPEYYRWTQWIFLRMFERGLAYRSNVPINWCSNCRVGLANEEVVDGCCERCGSDVETRDRTQWMLEITAYAERLLEDLDKLDWPEKVKSMQRNWIGRSEGAEILFTISSPTQSRCVVEVFTTRPDTLWGATCLVLAPEHHLVSAITRPKYRDQVEQYVDQVSKTTSVDRKAKDREKSGVFTGAYTVNPANGETIPVYVADYVLKDYGTGAIMAVPAHDERDFAFAKKFNLPVVEVIAHQEAQKDDDESLIEAYTGEGVLVSSGSFNGMNCKDAIEEIVQWCEQEKIGRRQVKYQLRDWVFSRQRYWGEPIPIIHCDACGQVPVPEQDLPVVLPEVDSYEVTGDGDSPLALIDDWVNTACPECGGAAKRETDTMPQWAGSSWYFLRYASPNCNARFADEQAVNNWLPVDMYVGGVEHAILHLLYARFFTKVLCDDGQISFDEPFTRLFNQGMITCISYRCNSCRKWVRGEGLTDSDKCPDCGDPLEVKLDKMSKSKANDVSPDELVNKYGADTVRCYSLFIGPPEKEAQWSPHGIEGCFRFLNRFYQWVCKCVDAQEEDSQEVLQQRHVLVKKVTERIETLKFNTAVAAHMEFLNFVDKVEPGEVSVETVEAAVLCLAPFAPHLAEELWQKVLGRDGSVFTVAWPEWDDALTKTEVINVAVQVNGKLRASIEVPVDAEKDAVIEFASETDKIKAYFEGKYVKRVVFVPARMDKDNPSHLVNFIVG